MHPLTCWNPSFQPTSSPWASFSCRWHVLHQIALWCVPFLAPSLRYPSTRRLMMRPSFFFFFNVPSPLSCTPLPFQRAVANRRARPHLLQRAVAFLVHAPNFSTRHRQSLCAPLPSSMCRRLHRARPYLFNVPSPIIVRAPTFSTRRHQSSCVPLPFQRAIANRCACPYLL